MKHWTKREDAYLFERYMRPDTTAAKIAHDLKRTRNEVIGRWHRIKGDAPCKPNPNHTNAQKRSKAKRKEIELASLSKGLMELKSNECRYIVGNDKYCADTIAKGSYCREHYDLCHAGASKKTVVAL